MPVNARDRAGTSRDMKGQEGTRHIKTRQGRDKQE